MKINSTLLKYFASILIFAAPISTIAETSFKGQVVYNNSSKTPMKGVEVLLKNTSGKIIATQFTDEYGNYQFTNLMEDVYTVDGKYDGEVGGIDFQDLRLILKHNLGLIKLEGISYLASDVDGSGVVDWNDYWHFLFDWFINGEDFKAGKWAFLSREINLTGSNMKDVGSDLMLSHGDGGGDWEPGVKNRHINPELVFVNTIAASTSHYYEIPVKFSGSESVDGFALALNYSDNVFIEEIVSDIENLNYSFENGVLKLSWMNTSLGLNVIDNNEALFTIKIRITEPLDGKQLFSLSDESHLIDSNGIKIDGAKLSMPQIVNDIENIEPELKGIYPNPVRDNAKIEYKLLEVSDVCLTLYNSNGQKISELVKAVQSSGSHVVNVNVNNLNLANGTYVYRLDCIGTQKFSESKLLIVCQ